MFSVYGKSGLMFRGSMEELRKIGPTSALARTRRVAAVGREAAEGFMAQLALVGLQDPMARHGHFQDIRYGPGPAPHLAVQGLDPVLWRICLSHRPSDWRLARQTGARLTLSGHTHGGQINLIPGLSSALIMGKYARGLYRRQGQLLYVSRGLGTVAIPVRIGAPPEITIITLRKG